MISASTAFKKNVMSCKDDLHKQTEWVLLILFSAIAKVKQSDSFFQDPSVWVTDSRLSARMWN